MECANCGQYNPETNQTCANCQANLQPWKADPDETPHTSPHPIDPDRKHISFKALLSLFLGVIATVGYITPYGYTRYYVLFGPIALVIGGLAVRDIAKGNGKITGGLIAFAGIVMGTLYTIVLTSILIWLFQLAITEDLPQKIRITQSDMRNLLTGIESYIYDKEAYPTSLNTLTSPISYISSIPNDRFSPYKKEPFHYFTPKQGGYILLSAGPDKDYDITPETDFNPAAPQNTAKTLSNKTYDPTNGTKSNGDIFKFQYQLPE